LNRRSLLGVLVAVPGAAVVGVATAEATEYASALEVFAAVDRLESEVELRLRALSESSPGAKAFAVSVLADLDRERTARARLRHRLGLPATSPIRPEIADLTALEALRAAQEALVHAHAEGLPALGDPFVVQAMAGHMVELSRHLAVTLLWIESEASRG
jgi:hypothetical protein